MPPHQSITIFYLSIGSGHEVAARAIAQALQREDPTVETHVIDPFTSAIELLPSVLERLQALSIILMPSIYDTLWRRGTPGSLFERVTDLGLFQDLLLEHLQKTGSKSVIATHVMPCALTSPLKKEGKIDHLMGVVTDFGLNTYWPLDNIDAYYVAHEELKNTLVFRGCTPQVIHPFGIPIRVDFEQAQQLKPAHQDNKLHVLLLAGGIRSGGYVEIRHRIFELLDTLAETGPHNIHMSIVCGSQEKLYQALTGQISQYPFPIELYGFVSSMHQLISQQDVIITKPGGLIVSECLACGVPMILFQPGPGQEGANVEFLARHGVALRGDTPNDVARALHTAIKQPQWLSLMRERARQLGKPYAARDIARHICSLL